MNRSLCLLLVLWCCVFGVAWGQCQYDNGFYSHESQCDLYYACRNGTVNLETCPDGLVFNEDGSQTRARCELPFNVNCADRPGLQPPQGTARCPRRWGLYSHETDCGKFYNCVDGTGFEFSCPEGLAYNDQSGVCDWPDLVPRCDAEAFLGFQCPEASPYEIQEFDNPPYAHPTDCAKHYVCVLSNYYESKRLPRLLSCEAGLVFNIDTRLCDYPENVPGCENYYGAREAVEDRRQTLSQG